MARRSEKVLNALMDSYAKGPAGFSDAILQLQEDLTPALASDASRHSTAATNQGYTHAALAYSKIAGRIYQFLGYRVEALDALMNSFNIVFMLTQTEPAYSAILAAINSALADDPPGHNNPHIGLRGRILAADCGFFGCEAAEHDDTRRRDLRAALESLATGAALLEAPGAAELHPNFASTLVAVYRRCLSRQWIGEPWAAANFATATRLLDQAAPQKLAYPEPGKDENIHQGRAEMSRTWNRGAYRDEIQHDTSFSGLFGRKLC